MGIILNLQIDLGETDTFMIVQKGLGLLSLESPAYKGGPWLVSGNLAFGRLPIIPRRVPTICTVW